MIIPISWTFQRKSAFPIIEVQGMSTVDKSENIMIGRAIEILEMAKRFKGCAYSNAPDFTPTNNFTVSFSIIFPDETEITSFLEYLQKND